MLELTRNGGSEYDSSEILSLREQIRMSKMQSHLLYCLNCTRKLLTVNLLANDKLFVVPAAFVPIDRGGLCNQYF
jgi:hypothetical protein